MSAAAAIPTRNWKLRQRNDLVDVDLPAAPARIVASHELPSGSEVRRASGFGKKPDSAVPKSGRSSAWLERYVRDVEVACSNHVAPTF